VQSATAAETAHAHENALDAQTRRHGIYVLIHVDGRIQNFWSESSYISTTHRSSWPPNVCPDFLSSLVDQ